MKLNTMSVIVAGTLAVLSTAALADRDGYYGMHRNHGGYNSTEMVVAGLIGYVAGQAQAANSSTVIYAPSQTPQVVYSPAPPVVYTPAPVYRAPQVVYRSVVMYEPQCNCYVGRIVQVVE